MNIIDFKHFIEKLIASNSDDKPTTATIIRINGNLADIQVGTSPVYLRNIAIYGDPDGFAVGDEVALIWTEKAGSYGPVPVIQSAPNITITTSGTQLLAITAPDPFSQAGWRVTSDGMIYKDDTRIHPDGQISLGSDDDIAIMSSANGSYRFWAGAIQPTSAPFSVSKAGAIKATSGEIASWNIETNQLYADSYDAILNASSYPYLGLGGATEFGVEGIWLGKDSDNTYKMYVGDPVGQHMYWDGSVLYVSGVFTGSMTMTGTQSTTWTINELSTNTDVTLHFEHPTADGTIIYDGSKFIFNKTVEMGGDVTFQDILPALADTYDIGSSTLRWRSAYISEMESILFVENSVSAIGGWLMIPHGQGSLNEDVDNSETQIDFGTNSIEVDDFILLRGNNEVEYMKATSLVSGNVWNVTRNLDGSGANAWPIGHIYVILGNTGDGRIELNAQTDGPHIGILEQGTAYNQQTERLRLGNLNNWQGAGLSGYGWAVGDFSGNEYAYYEPGDGMIIRGTIKADDGYLSDLNVSGALDVGTGGALKSVSSAILSIDSGYYFEYNSGFPRFRIGKVISISNSITNGTFDTDTDWIKETGWTITGGKAVCSGAQTGYSHIRQESPLTRGDAYSVRFTLSDHNAGNVRSWCGGSNYGEGEWHNTNGTYTELQHAYGNDIAYIQGDADFDGKVDDVEYYLLAENVVINHSFTTDTDWVKGDGWTISGGRAAKTATVSKSNLYQSGILAVGVAYVITFSVTDYTSGEIRPVLGTYGGGTWHEGVGRYTETLICEGTYTSVTIQGSNDFVGKIDNVHVYKAEEIKDWDKEWPALTKGIHWDGTNLIIEASTFQLDAAGNLKATGVDLTGTIKAVSGELQDLTVTGDLNVISGNIRGGATGYNVGEGFWLGKDGAEWKFFIGNAAGNKLTYDGTTLTLAGEGSGITSIDGGNITAASVDSAQMATNFLQAGHVDTGTLTGDMIALTTALSIKSTTYGADGIQLQYNAGNPRAYIGNGASSYFKFDGTNTYMSGTIYATGGSLGSLDVTGTLSITGSGKLIVGSNFEINDHGLEIVAGSGYPNIINWLYGTADAAILNAYGSATDYGLYMQAGSYASTKKSTVAINAKVAGEAASELILISKANDNVTSAKLRAGHTEDYSYIEVKAGGIEIWGGYVKFNGTTMWPV